MKAVNIAVMAVQGVSVNADSITAMEILCRSMEAVIKVAMAIKGVYMYVKVGNIAAISILGVFGS